MRMNTTLVINPKGGSGKTTVTTNLASHFAAGAVPTTVMDYDPQGSSLNWLRLRAPHAPKIHPANGAPAKAGGFDDMAFRRKRAEPCRKIAFSRQGINLAAAGFDKVHGKKSV